MGRVSAFAALVVWIAGLAACGSGAPEPPAPSFVFIIADDQGFRDFGFMGSPVAQTPALDALAAEGFVFRSGYSTSSRCRPALRTLLTGLEPLQYQAGLASVRGRLRAAGDPEGPDAEIRAFETLPRLLGRNGWTSFQSGKHFEGSYAAAGFDEGMTRTRQEEGNRIARETMQPVFDFLDRHRDEPFLLWFAPMLPHLPHDASEALLARYADAPVPRPLHAYYANVTRLDQSVAALLAHLDARGLAERTLVVFLVDNGWHARLENTPFDGPRGKGSIAEIGFRTPIVLRWRGRIAPGRSDALVSIVDLFPTVLDYAAVDVPPGRPGHSLRPIVEGRTDRVRDSVAGYMEVLRPLDDTRAHGGESPTGAGFWREGPWRYVLFSDGVDSLYDLSRDPDEALDLADRRPEVAQRLRPKLLAWLRRMRATPPPEVTADER